MVTWLKQRFGADPAQAERVSQTAQQLLSSMLGNATDDEASRHLRKLHWAAQLHEVGMHISHSDYHKHGAYILDNTDLPGFTIDELHRLSQLVLGHRGKLRKLDQPLQDPLFVQQLMALRMAVILCHARRDPDTRPFELSVDTDRQTTKLKLSTQWAEQWPQSAHLLKEESIAWLKTGWELKVQFS
jgi:exopolyphosphatase/guanosine-5'-triphosphate,3'-diphosphate pyrophosphatase